MRDLRAHDVDMLTLGQYLQPSRDHLPVRASCTPAEFEELGRIAEALGFSSVASGAAGALLLPRRPAGRPQPAEILIPARGSG